MNIGEVAKATGIPAKTIRYYESVGLVGRPARTAGNYRVYGEREIRTLRFVQRARHLGFSIKEIANLLALWHDRERASAEVRALAVAHLEEIGRPGRASVDASDAAALGRGMSRRRPARLPDH